ncbi:MAG: CAP domain-containing protein [Sphingobacteriia bacterium]|nr:CAP domain-containing protein [Sphingobacteriia bacterium]
MKKYIAILLLCVTLLYFVVSEKNDLKNKGQTSGTAISTQSIIKSTIATPTTTQATTIQTTVTPSIPTSQAQTTKATTSKKPVTQPPTTSAVTTVPITSTYSVTTSWAGTSTLLQTPRTIEYTQDGESKSINVTVITGFENEMLAYINNERENAGKSSLYINTELSELAIIRAAEAGVLWSHTRPNGTICFTVLDLKPDLKNRIYCAGENLAWNQTTVPQVMTDWMNSPGHRANILKDEYNCVGLGLVIVEREDGSFDPLWAQMFAQVS